MENLALVSTSVLPHETENFLTCRLDTIHYEYVTCHLAHKIGIRLNTRYESNQVMTILLRTALVDLGLDTDLLHPFQARGHTERLTTSHTEGP